MKKFTVGYLNSLACDGNQLHLAHKLISDGAVSITLQPSGCAADIASDDGYIRAYASISTEGDRIAVVPSRCRCSCGAARTEDGFICCHIMAAAMEYQDNYVPAADGRGTTLSADAAAEARRVQNTRGAGTDSCIMDMLDRHSAACLSDILYGKVSVETTLTASPKEMTLYLRIGENRFYTVKSIGELLDRVSRREYFSYGKQLAFTHHITSFREEDRPLIRFLGEWYDYQTRGEGYKRYKGDYGSGDRYFRLSGICLDAFFEAYSSDRILLEEGTRTEQLQVVKDDPPLELVLTRDGGQCAIDIKRNISFYSLGEKRSAAVFGRKLYFCSEQFTRSVLPIAEAILINRRGVRISVSDMTPFMTFVLPEIMNTATVDVRTDLKPFVPPELSACIYINRYSDTEIAVSLQFVYGRDKYPGFGPDIPHSGDRVKEQSIRALAEDIFAPCRLEGDRLVRKADEEFLYELENRGRVLLERYCRIFCDDDLRFRIRGAGSVSVGVRIDSGLLTMDIDLEEEEKNELAGILASLHARKKYHRLRSGEFLSLENSAISQLADIAEGLDLTDSQLASGRVELPVYRALYLDSAVKASGGISFERDVDFRRIARTVRSAVDSDYDLPKELFANLRRYQRAGYRWLMTLSDSGLGGILADDMGLGKTLEMLTVLLALRQRGCGRPSIVACPASLVLNWQSESLRYTPSLNAVCVLGSQPERGAIIREALKPGKADLIITSYDALKRDIGLYENAEFECVIADEAQYMKNFRTQNAKSMKRLSAKRRFALTGTPVENNLSELWSIFDFIMPGYLFGYARFRQRYEIPIVRDGDERLAASLRLMVSPFILRRMKSDVLGELPPKTETVIPVEMEDTQRKLYIANTAEARRQLGEMSGAQTERFQILAILTRLRQLCCDPSLVYDNYTGGSAKLEMCMELVRQCIDSGNKLLLFSQFTSMLDIIEPRLEREGIQYYRISGDTPVSIRQFEVDQFNRDDVPVFLISLKAGGTGLNLTGASCVIHYDPWWNVSAQNQATDRAHRIGQLSAVQVFKLVVKDSIEEKILRLQQSKVDLIDKVIEADQAALSSVTTEELIALLEEHAEG